MKDLKQIPHKKKIAAGLLLLLLTLVVVSQRSSLKQGNSGEVSQQTSGEVTSPAGVAQSGGQPSGTTGSQDGSVASTSDHLQPGVNPVTDRASAPPATEQGTSTAIGGVAVVESKTPSSTSATGAISGQPTAPAEKSFFGIKLSMFGFGRKPSVPSLGVNGGAGTPSVTSNVSGTLTSPSKELAKETPAEVKPLANCYVVNFKHKASSHHKTRQACAQHRNFLKLTDSTINLKSVCIRVDGIPVAYEQVKEKGKSEVSGLMLAGIAGPDSRISLKYCINKHDCNEDCKVPKDEFMDAIGGTDPAENGKIAVVRWDPSDAENDRDVVAEMDSEIKKELSESAVFADWVGNAEASECRLNKAVERKVANSN